MRETASLKDGIGDDSSDSSLESEVAKLRGRWELASVLNFLNVFEPVIGSDSKMTAEEIEMGLIKPNSSLAKLHITLLKGIPPVSKTLNASDAWVTALCKKLAMWWPWVAEGEIPLTVAKGEEVLKYKELDPTSRLQILKALCEIRADQDDTVSYLNDSLKQGTQISCFRKDKIGGDGNGTSYWYDGNTLSGYRLYREVKKSEPKSKVKGKAGLRQPGICFKWETIATNLEEFRKVSDELSSSRIVAEVAVGKTLESDAIPVIEKIQKKKERVLKRKQREQELLNFRNSYNVGITRSCRTRRPISYTFDDYDRAIDEAIQISKKGKAVKEQRPEKKQVGQGKAVSNGDSDVHTGSNGLSGNSTDSGSGSDELHEADNGAVDDNDDNDYDGWGDDDDDNGTDRENSDKELDSQRNKRHAATTDQKPVGSRWSERLTGATSHTRMLGTKNMLRQRPTRNSALDSIVPDSDGENSPEHGNCPPVIVADSEDGSDS